MQKNNGEESKKSNGVNGRVSNFHQSHFISKANIDGKF